MEPANALTQTIASFYNSLDDMLILSIINEVFMRYNFNNKLGFLQFWMCRAPPDSEGNGFNLRLMHQPFVSTAADHEGLIKYREKSLENNDRIIRFGRNVGNWLAGRSAQVGIADHRTRHLVLSPHYQTFAEAEGLGQLVMPVFSDGPDGKLKFEGIIELVTTIPKDSYDNDHQQIWNLLEDFGLYSKYMGKTIKVDYAENLIKFTLPYSAELSDLHNEVTHRFPNLQHTYFRIEYRDTNGNLLPISSGEELRASMAESCSQGAPFVKMYILDERSSIPYNIKRKRVHCSNIMFL